MSKSLAKKSAVGRPTKYKPSLCQKLVDFFKQYKIDKDNPDYPTLGEFAKKMSINRCSINLWAQKHEEFSKALKEVKELQTEILLRNALNGTYVASVAIFALKNVAGWRDDRFVLDQSEHQHLTIVTEGEKDKPERTDKADREAEFSLPAVNQ